MCKSISEGGQRCAAHTRPRYEAAAFGTLEWDEAAAAFASTPTGRKELEAARRAARTAGDTERVVAIERALHFGEQQREVAAATKVAIDQARAEERAARDSDSIRGREVREAEERQARYQANYDYGRFLPEYIGNELVYDPCVHDGRTHTRRGSTYDPKAEALLDDFNSFDFGRDPDAIEAEEQARTERLAQLSDDHPVFIHRLTDEGRALYDQAVAGGVSAQEAHLRAWRKHGYT